LTLDQGNVHSIVPPAPSAPSTPQCASVGDGSHGADPGNLAQDPETLLGKMLRIDVETGNPATYTVPPTNPFVGIPGHREEIWALGLREPWRFWFDRLTGDIYIGDVGEDSWGRRRPASRSRSRWRRGPARPSL